MLKRYILFIIFAIAMSVCLNAQSQVLSTIHGRLVSKEGVPIAHVRIELKALHRFVYSNSTGDFVFLNLPTRIDSLIVSSLNYEYYKSIVSICCANHLEIGNIILKNHITVLENIEVKGNRNWSYKSDYSFIGTKIQSSIKNIPQTISVISHQLIQDRKYYSLNDAIEEMTGVNLFSDYEEYTIRGFRAENPGLINGLRTFNASLVNPMLANIERVEVVKGPSAVLYGNCDPGGLINMVTKKPLAEKMYRMSVSSGSWDDYRTAIDFTGPLDKKQSFLYRLNTAYRNSNSFRNQLFSKSFQVAPSFLYAPDPKINLSFDFSISHVSTVVDRGQPGLMNSSDLTSTPINLSIIQPGDYLHETNIASIVTGSYKFNSHVCVNSSYLNYITFQKLSEHGIKNYITNDSLFLFYANRTTRAITNNITNYIVFSFTTNKFKHQLLLGYDIIANNARFEQWNGELPEKFDSSGIVGTFSLEHPSYIYRPVSTYSKSNNVFGANDNDDAAKYFTQGVYLQEQLSLSKWEFLFSLRQEFYRTGNDDQNTGNLDSLAYLKQNVLLPRIGVTYKLIKNINLYATWNKGFEPFEVSANLPAFGGPFKPIYSQLFEAGIKNELFKRKLYAAFSVYKIKQTNILINANDLGNPDRSIQAGNGASTGFEFEANGNIFSRLSIAISYAYNITKIASAPDMSENSKREANAPKNISNSWIKYQFTKGVVKHFTIAIGHSQVSRRNTYSTLILPGYCIFNTRIAYAYKNFMISCSLNNITNKIYYEGGYNNINKWPGKPFNAIMEILYQFH